jgi:chromosome segregation ATPase
MDVEQLKTTIRDLHADLEKTGEADPELRKLLRQLDNDLHRLLAARAEVEKEQSGFQERLESIAADFDTRHPQLAGVLREIGVALARVGI